MRFVDLAPVDERLTTDVLPVLRELRQDLTAEQFTAVYAEGYPQGLRFTAVYDGESCVAVAGWRLMATTVALRKLYVDDLVTTDGQRGHGLGAALLRELQSRARQAGSRPSISTPAPPVWMPTASTFASEWASPVCTSPAS